MRKPVKPIIPHHPVHHGQPHHGHAHQGHQHHGHGKAGHGKPVPGKPKKPAQPKKPPKPKRVKARKPVRKWSPGSDVACCSAEALGFLLGWDWQQILGLYWRTAAAPDTGASILDTLAAAGYPACEWPYGATPAAGGLIVGVQLIEPHALAVTPDGRWWSWGEPFKPLEWPDMVIEEAWWLP